MLYFQNAWRKNERLVKLLEEKVYAAGKTAIFLYAPGYGQHGGVEGMKALTKMTYRQLPFGAPLFYLDNASRPIGERACLDTEVFAVTDADVEVLGRYLNGGVAAARKERLRAGLGLPGLLLAVHEGRELARQDLLCLI